MYKIVQGENYTTQMLLKSFSTSTSVWRDVANLAKLSGYTGNYVKNGHYAQLR